MPEELIVNVYVHNGNVDQWGYHEEEKGMISFVYDDVVHSLREECDDSLAERITSDIGESLMKKSKIENIKFNFPICKESLSIYADGYFGRPPICTGAIFLKPVSKIKRIVFSKEIDKISHIEDKWGDSIKLMANSSR